MRVSIVNTLYPPIVVGGAEKSVELLAKALSVEGCDVSVITLHPEAESVTSEEGGVRIYRIPIRNIYWPFGHSDLPMKPLRLIWHIRNAHNTSAANDVRRVLNLVKPDIVHTNNLTGFSTKVWSILDRDGFKSVHTLRDYSLICPRATMFKRNKVCKVQCSSCSMFSQLNRIRSNLVSSVVSNSNYTLKKHIESGFFGQVKQRNVIFNAETPMPSVTSHHPPVTSKTIRFGYIGKIAPEKGIELLLRALAEVQDRDFELNVAGNGNADYLAFLKRKYINQNVNWLGFTATSDFFDQIDVLVIPSIWAEPLPRVLIEAISYKCPTIASSAGGIPDLAASAPIIELYEPTDYKKLRSIIDRTLKLGLEKVRIVARPTQTIDLSTSTLAARYMSVYKSALK